MFWVSSITFITLNYDEVELIENVGKVALSDEECHSVAYVAGWVESKCTDIQFAEEGNFVDEKEKGLWLVCPEESCLFLMFLHLSF